MHEIGLKIRCLFKFAKKFDFNKWEESPSVGVCGDKGGMMDDLFSQSKSQPAIGKLISVANRSE